MRTKSVAAVLAPALALGVGMWVWSPWKKSEKAAPSRASGAAAPGPNAPPRLGAIAPALRVNAVQIVPQSLAEQLTATGTLRSDEGIELQPEINGKVVQISFTEGARVNRGDLLVKLNDADLRAQLSRAVFRRELAELKERRLAQLLESGSVRQDDYDTAANDLSVQRSEVTLIEAMIGKTEIRAPFSGVIGLRFVSEGTFVTPTTKIATLQSFDRVKVDFSIPEKYAPRTKMGARATFTVSGMERRFDAEIYAIDPRVDAATRTVLLRAICSKHDGLLLPGAFASIEFTLTEIGGAILVPSEAVVPGVSERYVFVAKDGKAERRPIELGTRTENSVQVVSGISPGEWVITSGVQQLREGLNVKINGIASGGGFEKSEDSKPAGVAAAAGKTGS